MPNSRVKGILLLARMKYLRAQGPAKTEAALGMLSPEDARQVRTMLLPSSWYPAPVLRRLEDAIATVMQHRSRDALYLDIGRAAATANLEGVQKVFLRVGDPQFVLSHCPSIYASSFSDGHRTYERTGDTSAVIRTVKAFQDARGNECLITVGWLTRAIEMSGGVRISVTEAECGLSGAARCSFLCTWELPAGRHAPAAPAL